MQARKQHVWALWAGVVTLALLVSPLISKAEKMREDRARAYKSLMERSDPNVKGASSYQIASVTSFPDGDPRIAHCWVLRVDGQAMSERITMMGSQGGYGSKLDPAKARVALESLPPSTMSVSGWQLEMVVVTRYSGPHPSRFIYTAATVPQSVRDLMGIF